MTVKDERRFVGDVGEGDGKSGDDACTNTKHIVSKVKARRKSPLIFERRCIIQTAAQHELQHERPMQRIDDRAAKPPRNSGKRGEDKGKSVTHPVSASAAQSAAAHPLKQPLAFSTKSFERFRPQPCQRRKHCFASPWNPASIRPRRHCRSCRNLDCCPWK
jgi:hypothetical protein